MEHRQELELLNKENLELKVKLNRTGRVFAPKNEQTPESEKSGPKKEVILDFEEVPCCQRCQTPYERISAFDKVSNCIEASISAVHEIVTHY